MHPFSFHRFAIFMSATLLVSLSSVMANPAVPPACSLVKSANLSRIIGQDVKFIPLMSQADGSAAMSMCAYEGKNGRHYGFSIREVETLPEGTTAQSMLNRAIETEMRAAHSARGLSQPNVGDAALWNARMQKLTVWIDDGKTTLIFQGNKTTPSLQTHLTIARRVIRNIR